jgi:hypothetical protein
MSAQDNGWPAVPAPPLPERVNVPGRPPPLPDSAYPPGAVLLTCPETDLGHHCDRTGPHEVHHADKWGTWETGKGRGVPTLAETVDVLAERLRPGDTIIVRPHGRPSALEADYLRRRIMDQLPGVTVVVIPVAQLLVMAGPQIDDPARPLVDLAVDDQAAIDEFLADPSTGVVRSRPVSPKVTWP